MNRIDYSEAECQTNASIRAATMIERIRVQGFKSCEDVTVDLEPVTVLIGSSGSGKSNFMDSIRFLRDLLRDRNVGLTVQKNGGWQQILCRSDSVTKSISFLASFSINGFPGNFEYSISIQSNTLINESLSVAGKCLFHQQGTKWVVPPNVSPAPQLGTPLLGAITGIQESSLAYSALVLGTSCHRFSDQILRPDTAGKVDYGATKGLLDSGANFIKVYAEIHHDLSHWKSLKQLESAMRFLKPILANITIDQPANEAISVAHEIAGSQRLTFDIAQESEGFRRLFICLLALYQRPPKQTLLFDEPEKGIYPAALPLLAEEFKACAASGRGQVILTTHSPQFLDHFEPEQIRVVEMKGYGTRIGPVSPEQMEAIHEQYLRTGELLTVDKARIAEPAAAE